jgi:hypothetical protein
MRKSLAICVYVNTVIAVALGLSFMLTWAPQLWPKTAQDWYARYTGQFWQEGLFFAGFREFPKDIDVGWLNMSDVDAGPVICGYGVAASAFGAGAARAMGRTDQAYKLAAEALVASWPLPDGTLLVPRVLSKVSDAPYLGEAATLFALTRTPVLQVQGSAKPSLPIIVPLGVFALLVLGAYEVAAAILKLRRWRRNDPRRYVPAPQFQALMWWILLGCAAVVGAAFSRWIALVFLLAALILPSQRKRSADEAEKTHRARSVA